MSSPTRTHKVKAWTVAYIGNGHSYIPEVGNGKQWQFPIFPTRKEAKEYKAEPHGLDDTVIIPCEIVYKIKK